MPNSTNLSRLSNIGNMAPSTRSQAKAREETITKTVIAATGPKASERLKDVLTAMMRHMHDFAREVNLTTEEWFMGIDLINQCGQMSTESRNETQLLCTILGLESLVDDITSRTHQSPASSISLPPTPSTILGPFYRPNAPFLPPYSSIVSSEKQQEYLASTTHFSGRVLSSTSGSPIENATLDIWHTAPNGMYEQQDPDQPDMDLRGRFQTDRSGSFSLYCLRPVAYPISEDGPVGKLLQRMDRHPFRPAHIHVIVSAMGYRTLTTQLFDCDDRWLQNDTAFAVKEELIVKFQPRTDDPQASWRLRFDFVLVEP